MRIKNQKRNEGFTLIELLTVIAIIGLLIGIVISVSSNVTQKAATARAKAEISALELALESFKIDNGDYPDFSGIAGATATIYPGMPSAYPSSLTASPSLFEQLVGRPSYASTASTGPQYLEVKESQSGGTATASYFVDPFGFAYGYMYDAGAASGAKSIFNQVIPYIWYTSGETINPADINDSIYLRWMTNWGSR